MNAMKLERPRPFFVHPADAPPHSGHQVPTATNAEDAALQYIELWSPNAAAEGDLRLIVEDCGSGHETCLTVHLALGTAEPCG